MTERNLMLFGRLTVGQKLMLMSVGVMTVIATIVGYTITAAYDQRSQAKIIDIVGRQRMLAERHLSEVLIAGLGQPSDHRETLRVFDQTLVALMRGGPAVADLATGDLVTVPAVNMAGAKEGLAAQRELLGQLQVIVDAFLAKPAGDQAATRVLELKSITDRLSRSADGFVGRLAAQADEKVAAMIRAEIVLAVGAGIGGLIISLLVARGISRPLRNCVERAQQIAEGHLNLPDLPVKSKDEIGHLSQSFNVMTASLREVALQTQSVTDSLNAAVAEILATTQQQASSAKEQAAAVQEITSTVEEIKQSGAQVTEKAKAVSGAAKAIASAGAAGNEAVRSISTAMTGIHQQAGSVAENIVTLSERTQTIGEIIATVNDIAEQSNLVALNAAIEAADAREDGRRFSVVAHEIKNLADQAKDATRQVRTILEEIQRGINTSVMLTEEAVKRVEYGRDKTAVAEDTITKMSQNIQESANAFQQIVGATNQQQIGIEQVTQALVEIRQATQQTASSTSQLNHAAGNLNTLAQQLRRVVEKYRV